MAARESAGLLLYRRGRHGLEVLLGHPGGPFWASRHEGAWTVPKGGPHAGEHLLDTAIREFREETGFDPLPPFIPLGSIMQRSGKLVHVWAFEGDGDPAALVSLDTTVEWPPHSGRMIAVPELDRVAFFSLPEARRVINTAQAALFDRLLAALG